MARVDFRSIQSNADAHGRQILFSMVNVRVVVKPNPGDKPSLLANSDFFFLILLKISHYTQLTQLFPRGTRNEVDTAQCWPHSASQCLTIPEEAGYQPAEQALLL